MRSWRGRVGPRQDIRTLPRVAGSAQISAGTLANPIVVRYLYVK
jgi:hypothetical protein